VSFLPIVVWIMRDQFNTIPVELEQAALVDGSSIWGAFLRIALPIAGPGMVASFILVVIFCWNEYLFAAILTSKSAYTLPQLIATQVSSQGVKYWTMAAVTISAVAPLIIIGIFLERYIVKGLTAGSVK
ncbi:MAG: carbohydrate ABC transporter permease, partial [Thermomicrobiales bacterium]|nr:carbohydrate ABC transporter permease [Thermomicrobiales bacterium]